MRAPFARTLFELLCEQAGRDADTIAVIDRGERVSYQDLERRARRLAGMLAGLGIKRGERVGLLCDNRAQWLEVAFGANAIGATLTPFSTFATRRELEFLLADSGIRVLFTLASLGERAFADDIAALLPESVGDAPGKWRSAAFPALSAIVVLDDTATGGWHAYGEAVAAYDPLTRIAPGDAASACDDAFVLYTSGSTSRPKAVRLANYAVIENGFNIGERQGLRAGDRVLIAPPLFWAYGASNALPASLSHGATMVLQGRFDPGGALELIETHRCTAIYTLPAMTRAMVRHPAFAPGRVRSLRTGLTIGSPQDVIEGATVLGAAELCNVYGGTESYGNCCVTWHHWPLERRASCQGPPLPGVEVRCRDVESGEIVAPGVAGEVEVRGYLTPGYTGQSAEHNGSLFTDDGFLRTGDIGRMEADGTFRFLGRGDEMIKRAGINVSPAEVEEVLLQHPGVAAAGVTGVPHPERGASIVAFVVANRGARPTAEEIVTHCRALASRYKVPDRVELRDSLPTTTTGKLQRRELARMALELESPAEEHPP